MEFLFLSQSTGEECLYKQKHRESKQIVTKQLFPHQHSPFSSNCHSKSPNLICFVFDDFNLFDTVGNFHDSVRKQYHLHLFCRFNIPARQRKLHEWQIKNVYTMTKRRHKSFMCDFAKQNRIELSHNLNFLSPFGGESFVILAQVCPKCNGRRR